MKTFSADDFGFEQSDSVDVVETEAQIHRNAFVALSKGATLKVDTKVFEIFADQGLVKYVTLAGTAGRKFYVVRPISLDPFEVEVRQVQQQVPEKLGPIVVKGRVT